MKARRYRWPIVAAVMLAPVLYVGSYFALAFACGAGWMEKPTRERIVWRAYRPISEYARSDFPERLYFKDANNWFHAAGWKWFRE
jgi:hypothetical protein